MPTPRKTYRSKLLRLLPAQYLLPMAALLFLSFGSLFTLLFHLTNVGDQMERQREVELVQNSLESAKRQADHDLRDYAMWDEAVLHLVRKFDPLWADDNLGPYLGRGQGYDYTLVLDGTDHLIYAYNQGRKLSDSTLKSELGPEFISSLEAVRALQGAPAPLITGFSRAGDEVYLYAVAVVVPLTGKVSLPEGRTTVIAIAEKLDERYLNQLSVEHNAPRLRLVSSALPGDVPNEPLLSASGQAIATSTWVPERPGSDLRRKILPAFIGIGLLCLAAGWVIMCRGRLALEALKFSEGRALHLSMHDPLTGLPNRRAMHERLQAEVDAGRSSTLLYLDLDGFKDTNDLYGHGAGDELLRTVAVRLKATLHAGDFLARVGGDEFVVISPTPQRAMGMADEILEAFTTPFQVASFQTSLGVSIGIAASGTIKNVDEMVRRADAAMYVAKSRGKHCCQVYSAAIDVGRELRRQLESDLRFAVANDLIDVEYQPIVCAKTREVVAVEALARWHHPDLGTVGPDRFIPIAEESGLIVPLGRSILRRACGDALHWDVDIAVNLSPAQFWDRDLADTIVGVLSETGFPPRRLELEITEGYLMRRPEAAADILRRLKALGIRIALDDFGTGFASIGYLQRLGFDSIKIDRSFVAAAACSAKAADLARAIVAIGEALELPVTAEGVETQGQAALMTAAGCDRMQGWLFGRSQTAVETGILLAPVLRMAG